MLYPYKTQLTLDRDPSGAVHNTMTDIIQEAVSYSCTLTKLRLIRILGGEATLDGLPYTGDVRFMQKLLSYLVIPNPSFTIVTA